MVQLFHRGFKNYNCKLLTVKVYRCQVWLLFVSKAILYSRADNLHVCKNTNKNLHVRTGHKDLITLIKQRQFRWLSHVFRKGNHSITKTALKWTPAEGKKGVEYLERHGEGQ